MTRDHGDLGDQGGQIHRKERKGRNRSEGLRSAQKKKRPGNFQNGTIFLCSLNGVFSGKFLML